MSISHEKVLLLGALWLCALHMATTKPPEAHNITSTLEHSATFSHIYNIALPKRSFCKVELDSLPLKDEGLGLQAATETAGGDEHIVFRHNIRVQSPQCDCESSATYKALALKLSVLEEEILGLKSLCNSNGCCGQSVDHQRWSSLHISSFLLSLSADLGSLCSGRGTFIRQSCRCECEAGWEGDDCSVRSCPNGCSDRGRCVDGRCVCDEGYAGVACSELLCPGNCGGHGRCLRGECQCDPGFTGVDCGKKLCPKDCSDHGDCANGVCFCEPGFTGIDCSAVLGPQALRLVRATEDSILVNWDHVTGVDYYLIDYYAEGEESSFKEAHVSKLENSYLLMGLQSGVEYRIQLYGVKAEVSSDPSSLRARTVLSLPGGLRVVRELENSLELQWRNPEAEVDYFMLTFSSLYGQQHEVRVQRSSGENSNYLLTGLHPGTLYLITVRAIMGELEGKPSTVNGTTEIDSPTNLVMDQVTENSASISWRRVQAEIDRYMINYVSANGERWQVAVRADQDANTLTGLRPGVEYTIYIWAEKGNQRSKRASTAAVTEIDSPTNLVTDQVTENSASISWRRVQAEIDRYIISYVSANGESRQVAVRADQDANTLTGLRPGVEYTIYIWAEKGNRRSKRASTAAVTEIDSPTNLVTDQVTENSASISWRRVQAEIDRYIISYVSANGESRQVAVRADQDANTLTGLRPGVEYTIYIWAEKRNRRSKRASTAAVTAIDAPRNLRVSDVTQTSGIVMWDPPEANIEGYILTYLKSDGTSEEVQIGAADQRLLLTDLELGMSYIIYLVAFRRELHSGRVKTTFTTVGVPFPFPIDCGQVLMNGNATSGVYTIYLNNDLSRPLTVYCDMTTDGGGWIVFMRRSSGVLDFYRNWKTYEKGFGDLTDEFWLGLQGLHNLTSTQTQYELRVDLQAGSESVYATYDNFKVAPGKARYKLTVGNYRGTAGDAMSYHNGRRFTAFDQDHDISLTNCAISHHGAWWYKNCHLANLNGLYGDNTHSKGVNWEPWKGHEFSIPFVEMKLRSHPSNDIPVQRRKKRSHGRKILRLM
ncbi:tenascin-N [Latimeria chalumnae]|uniref:tenascin-N n=1 Tax=Latimeria chalumnae TaxID=7897 RepID=UPI00313B0B81